MFEDEEINKKIDAAIAKMKALLGRLASGVIDWAEFKDEFFDMMTGLYFDTAAEANGGALSIEQTATVERALAEQFNRDIGEDFSLEDKMSDFELALITLGQFAASLAMYLKSSKVNARQVWADNNSQKMGVRKLGATDNHCVECVALSLMGPQRLADMVMPGRECRCYTNCLCTVEILN